MSLWHQLAQYDPRRPRRPMRYTRDKPPAPLTIAYDGETRPMGCDHVWVSSGEALMTADPLHHLVCTRCLTVWERVPLSVAKNLHRFGIHLASAADAFRRRGDTDIADIYDKLLAAMKGKP